jgi:hypothetical protein
MKIVIQVVMASAFVGCGGGAAQEEVVSGPVQDRPLVAASGGAGELSTGNVERDEKPTPTDSKEAKEFPFEPEWSTLVGFLRSEYRYGPPNYGETPGKDQKIPIYLLALPSPITVGTADTLSEVNKSVVQGVTEVQVQFAEPLPTSATGEVVVRGRLSKQILSHDFLPIVLRDAVLSGNTSQPTPADPQE